MTKSATKPKQDTIEFDMDCTTTDNVVIPMRLVVTYPKGYGFYAAKSLQMMPDNMDAIWNDLIHRQDRSTMEVMMSSGHMGDDEDDES